MKICATSSLALACFSVSISAFSTRTVSFPPSSTRLYADAQQDAFAAFADSLEEDTVVVEEEKVDESWQERLEMLLDPLTPLAQRQVLMSELMASNEDIRNSVTAALRDRKVSHNKTRVVSFPIVLYSYILIFSLPLYYFSTD